MIFRALTVSLHLAIAATLLPACADEAPDEPAAATPESSAANTAGAESSSSPSEPEEPSPADPAGGACLVDNGTDGSLDLRDTAIDEALGSVEPRGRLRVGGHFEARDGSGRSVHGFCPSGTTVRIVVEDGALQARLPDGSPARDGLEREGVDE